MSPMEQIGVDIFESAGKPYPCAIDRFSGFPLAARLRNMTTSAITRELEKIFMTFRYAGTIRTDNGPAFRSEFGKYCASCGMKHETSSPHYPRSNRHPECGVKMYKHLLQKCRNDWNQFEPALLEWRNVPWPSSLSPAQLMFGRGQRTTLPKLTSELTPIDMDLAKTDRPSRDEENKACFDKNAHVLDAFHEGDKVLIQDNVPKKWSRHGVIKQCLGIGCSYIIAFPDGGPDVRRNRRFLRKL